MYAYLIIFFRLLNFILLPFNNEIIELNNGLKIKNNKL